MRSRIECHFSKHDLSRVCQGDLLRDLKFNYILNSSEVQEFYFPYSVVVSQDCDLEQYQNKAEDATEGCVFNQYIPNLLIIPAFTAESLRDGEHLINLYNFKHDRLNSDKWKIVKFNNNERYHYIESYVDMQIPNLVCDFKHFFTISFDLVMEQYSSVYLATMSELFRERLSQRFSNYFSRIGLPQV